ncbi:MAG TPA: gluconate 2-dehydrogenase subunit 3 family protein [Vicinamibacterales bacterium]|nr:gluconate 2-dehydrogenase subunit 3 family protein [Vicinamibacterales bacterium]
MEPLEHTAQAGVTRREAIRRAALLAGIAIAPEWLAAAEQPAATGQKAYLTAAQGAIVAAIADRILPRTDTPGARDVGVPAFIDRLYGEFMTEAERALLAGGLADVDEAARSIEGGAFGSLAAERQDVLLRGIARAEEGRDQGFFRLIRSATVLGYFTSEEVGRNVLNYDPVPGRYDGCVPIAQVGRRNWTT